MGDIKETFAESKGLPANAHAKEVAKRQSRKPKVSGEIYYTQKGDKVLKKIVKPHGTQSVYIGNVKKHKDVILTMIAGYKKEGLWAEGESAVEAMEQKLKAKLKK